MGELTLKHDSIETGPDKLHKLVKEGKSITIHAAANILKVPTETIECWCEALEENGSINTKQTLKATYLLNPDFDQDYNNFWKTLFLNLKGINSNTKVLADHAIKEKKAELDKKDQLLKQQLRKTQQYEEKLRTMTEEIGKHQSIITEQEAELFNKNQLLEQQAKNLEEQEKQLIKQLQELHKQTTKLQNKETELKRKENVLVIQERNQLQKHENLKKTKKELAKKETLIQTKEAQLSRLAQQLVKQLTPKKTHWYKKIFYH